MQAHTCTHMHVCACTHKHLYTKTCYKWTHTQTLPCVWLKTAGMNLAGYPHTVRGVTLLCLCAVDVLP